MGGSLVWVGEPELPLTHSGQKLFPAAERRRAHRAVTAVEEGKGSLWVFFFLQVFFVVEEQNSGGNSPFMVHPLMSWCVSGSGWIFSC